MLTNKTFIIFAFFLIFGIIIIFCLRFSRLIASYQTYLILYYVFLSCFLSFIYFWNISKDKKIKIFDSVVVFVGFICIAIQIVCFRVELRKETNEVLVRFAKEVYEEGFEPSLFFEDNWQVFNVSGRYVKCILISDFRYGVGIIGYNNQGVEAVVFVPMPPISALMVNGKIKFLDAELDDENRITFNSNDINSVNNLVRSVKNYGFDRIVGHLAPRTTIYYVTEALKKAGIKEI